MQASAWFWCIYVLCCIFGGWQGYQATDRRWFGGGLVIFILIGLVGWGVFGSPLK